MPAPPSRDLPERIAHAVEGGPSIPQATFRFGVSPSIAVKLMQRFRESGSTAPARLGGHCHPIVERHERLYGLI
jgi:transposase